MAPALRRTVKRTLAVLAGGVLCVVAAEALLRWTPLGERAYYRAPIYVGERATRPSRGFVPDADVGWRMQPGGRFQRVTEGREVEYIADERGYRTGEERLRRGAEREHRVVLVGDSFAWGFGVTWEESCAGELERALPDCAVDVLAMPGFGLDQMAASVRHWALPLEPDLVVVAIFSDDLSRCFTAYRDKEGFEKPLFRLVDGELVRATAADRPGALRLYMERETKLFPLLWSVRRVLGKRHGIGGWWALQAALLDRIVSDLEAADVPLLFIHIPKRSWTPMPALARHLETRGAPLIDLTSVSAEPLDELYFETDGHFSPRGHAWLAGAIHDWIRRELPELD